MMRRTRRSEAVVAGVLAWGLAVPAVGLADHLPPVDPLVAGANHDHEDHSGHDHSSTVLTNTSLDFSNLSGVDFGGSDLSDASLENANATGTDFTGATLFRTDLRYATVTGADFTGADLYVTYFGATVGLSEAQIRSASRVDFVRLSDQNLAGFDLSGLDFTDASFSGSNLDFVSFAGSNLTAAYLANLDLSMVDLSGADLTEASVFNSGIGAAQLRSASSVVGLVLGDADYSGEDLSGLDFTGGYLGGMNFTGSNLTGTVLADTDLRDVILAGANLTNADFSHPQVLEPARLLSAATLAGATLAGLTFWGEDLTGTILTGANLENVDFRHADLSGSIGLATASFDSLSWYDPSTVFPPGFDPVASGLTAYGSPGIFGTTTTIVSSDELIPGKSWTFGQYALGFVFGGLDLNDAGQVAFDHSSAYADLSTGLYLGDGGAVTTLVDYGSPAPGTSGIYSFFYAPYQEPVISEAGDVAFNRAVYNSPGTDGAIWLVSGGVDSNVVLEGDPAPVPGGGTYGGISVQNCVDRNESGRTVFNAFYTQTGGGTGSGLFDDQAGVQTPVFLSGDPAPGTGGGTYAFTTWQPCGQINDTGVVVAAIPVEGGTTTAGLFRADGGVESAIVLVGDPAPGTGGGTFADFPGQWGPRAWINGPGDVVFVANVTGGAVDRGIFVVESGGTLRLVAAPGEPAPGTGTVYDFVYGPAMNDDGVVAFVGRFDGLVSGIFLDVGGVHAAVALNGDAAPAALGDGIYWGFGEPKINDAGEVAFAAATQLSPFADAIVLLPEPATPTGLALASLALASGTRGRRRSAGRRHGVQASGCIS